MGSSPRAAAMMCRTSVVAIGCTFFTIQLGTGVTGRRSTILRTSSNEVEPDPRMMAARNTVAGTDELRKTSSTCRRDVMWSERSSSSSGTWPDR